MNESATRFAPKLHDWSPGRAVPPPAPGSVHVFRVDLGPLDEVDVLERLPHWGALSEEERARARRFVRVRDGRRFARCRGALREILGALLSRAPGDVAFRAGAGGKPELAGGGPPPLRFNVTHSDELALIAVSAGRELGVDVERLRAISESARIVASYFTTAERDRFLRLVEGERETAFLRGWTRKEAILKARGVGLAGLATGYETHFGTRPLGPAFVPVEPYPRVQQWALWEAAPCPGYVAALAVEDAEDGEPPA
jgi:4'-phosphopantetheinyl transferase